MRLLAAAFSAVMMTAVLPAAASVDSRILANTQEITREIGPGGYAKTIHGRIHINGHTYPFVSGGRGRGAAPFGEYHVGPLGGFGGRKGKKGKGHFIPGFPLSDAFDPFVKDTRNGLFIHPGRRASKGCLAIFPDVWGSFVKDMLNGGGHILFLGHELDDPPWIEPVQVVRLRKGKGHAKVMNASLHHGMRKGTNGRDHRRTGSRHHRHAKRYI